MKLKIGDRLLLLGATSAIARATALELARKGCVLSLAGRSSPEIEAMASDLRVRLQATVFTNPFDATDYGAHSSLMEQVTQQMGGLDGAFIFFGDLGDPELSRQEFAEAQRVVAVNYLGAVSVLTPLANHFEARGGGAIVGVSSVAGDRGRQSNYVYGSAKAALSTFLQGLRNRLAGSNVQVLTVKPGLVDTPMTYGSGKTRLMASPERVARDLVASVEKGKDVVYLPWYWRWIMAGVKALPEGVFKRLKL